jgi:hypothetical protein
MPRFAKFKGLIHGRKVVFAKPLGDLTSDTDVLKNDEFVFVPLSPDATKTQQEQWYGQHKVLFEDELLWTPLENIAGGQLTLAVLDANTLSPKGKLQILSGDVANWFMSNYPDIFKNDKDSISGAISDAIEHAVDRDHTELYRSRGTHDNFVAQEHTEDFDKKTYANNGMWSDEEVVAHRVPIRVGRVDAPEVRRDDIDSYNSLFEDSGGRGGHADIDARSSHSAPSVSGDERSAKRRKLLNGETVYVQHDAIDYSVLLNADLYAMPARELESWRKAFSANKRLPFGGQIFRLDMLCETGSATYLPKPEEAGLNIMDESNIILGHNAKTFEMTVAARVTSGAFVPYPSRIGLSPFIACLAIHTGFGTEPVENHKLSGNGQAKGDLIFCATPMDHQFNSFFEDFTNNPSPKLVEVQHMGTGYDPGKLFSTFYNRALADATPFNVSDPKEPQAPTPSLAIAAAHLAWNPQTNRIDRHVKGYDDMGANATWETYAMLQDGGGDSNYVYSHSLHQ